MQEYVSDAVVLAKRPSGELDARYSLFTKKFGKMVGRAKSSRKITSKLAGHLEPGSMIKARFIEKSGMQIVDALKMARVEISQKDLSALEGMIPEMETDVALWDLVAHGSFSWTAILAALGWDPAEASCAGCGKKLSKKWASGHPEEFPAENGDLQTRNAGAFRGGNRRLQAEITPMVADLASSATFLTASENDVAYFFVSRQEFFCPSCVSKLHADEVTLIKIVT